MQYERFFNQPSKFNILSISPVKELQYFIAEYPNPELIDSLFELQKNYSYYRAIAGDGNCYYRAIIFQYLKVADLSNKNNLFPRADLLRCKGLPFDRRGGITSEGIIDYIYTNYLWPLEDLSAKEREKRLEESLNKSKNLDASLIAYFRVLNHNYLARHRSDYQIFSDAGIDQDLDRILTYGQQSEGIELFTLSMVLEAKVTIVVVHQQNYTQYDLNNQQYRHSFIVSYRPGHYDIPVNASQVDRNSVVNTPAPPPQSPIKTFGSSILNRISQQRQAKSFEPERIVINRIDDIQLLRRVSEGNKNKFGQSRIIRNCPPEKMSQFRESISRSSLKVENKRVTTEKQTESKPQELRDSRSTKLPRNSLVSQKEKAKNNKKLFEGIICVFFIFVAGTAAFMI